MDILKAPCGLNCGECNLYNAGSDMRAAEALADWFRSRGWIGPDEGAEAVRAKAPLCAGCRAENGPRFCGECHMRACCHDKNISHCGECGEFPCEKYLEWTVGMEHHMRAMENLLEYQKSRA